MPGEFFQSERGQIKAVEAQAQKEKKEKVSTELQAKKDLLHNEVGKAGKMLADAESKLTVPASKVKVAGYKSDISSTLKDIVNSGQNALKAENPDADLAVMDMLAGSLKSTLNTVKQYVPLFNDVEDAKGYAPKIEEKLKKARDAKEKNGLRSPEFNLAMSDADELLLKAQATEIYLWKPESLPADMQAILMSVLAPLKDQEAEIAGYRLELTEKSALEDDPNELPEVKEGKAAMRILKPAKAAFDTAQVNIKKISVAVKDSENKPESLDGLSGSIDTSITDLGDVLKQLKTIDKTKITDSEYVTLYENTLQKVNLQLQELANLKVSLKTRELMTKGLTDEEKKYVTMDEKGNITKTPEFAKLPKDKQMALEAKFKLIEIEVGMELDEKTAGEKEKKMIEGRKKLMAGDPFGAKEDLLAYYNQEAKNTERDPVRFEQTKEMLKQIAKMELSQMVQRLALMKASVKERYNNNVVGKTDFGTQTYQQAYDNIDDMARVIDAAEELIEAGKCVTIEGAEAQLRKFEFPPNTVVSIQSADEKVAAIKQKGEDELKKGKDERVKREKDTVERMQRSIKGLESGEIQTTIDGQPVTAEYIEKLKAELRLQQEKTSKVEGMSLEDERAAELEPAQRDLKRAKLDQALKSWKAGFPVDISSNSWEVFDMFVQQRKLNDADPEVRKQATLEEARKARERGFTGLARQMYESYFSKQLQEGAKSVDKNAVREKTLKNPEVSKKLDQSLSTWKSDFKKQWGRDPEDTEIEEARGKMQNMVVSEAYNKEVKLSTYNMLEGASGPEADEWRKIYGGTVAIENFGQGGVLTAFWTDEEWSALPVKVGVFTAVTIASGGLGSAAVAGTGMAARAVLGEIIVGRVLATAGGRALAWAGSAAVEGAVFSAAQYEFNNMLLGNGYERFSAEYWKAMGHSIVTMGVLKGVGAGVGKLRSLAEAGNAGTFIEGGVTSVAKDAAWWMGKTSLEGGALVGLDAGMAFLSGRHFTAKEAAKSFGENFIFSAAMGGVHEFMGQGGHEGTHERKDFKSKEHEVASKDATKEVAKAAELGTKMDKAKERMEELGKKGKDSPEYKAAEKDFQKAKEEFEKSDVKAEALILIEKNKAQEADNSQKEHELSQHLEGMCPCHKGLMAQMAKVDLTSAKDVFERGRMLDAALVKVREYQKATDKDGHIQKARTEYLEQALDSNTDVGKRVDKALVGQQIEVEVKHKDGTVTKEKISIDKALLTPDTLLRIAQGEPIELGTFDKYLHKHLGENINNFVEGATKKDGKKDKPEDTKFKEGVDKIKAELSEALKSGDRTKAENMLKEFGSEKQVKDFMDGVTAIHEKVKQGLEVFTKGHAELNAEGKEIAKQFMSETVNKTFDEFAEAYEKESGQKIDRKALEKIKEEILKAGIDQNIDNPPQYVSHGFDHSLRVMENVDRVIKGSPETVKNFMEQYGVNEAQARLMMKMVGVCHDFGYPTVGELNKSLHAITGTYAFLQNIAAPLGKAMNLDINGNPQHQKLIKNFANSIQCHSADKEENNYKDHEEKRKELKFNRKLVVELKIPGTEMTYFQEFLFMQSTFIDYPGGQTAVKSEMASFFKRNGMEIVGDVKVIEAKEGQLFSGRYLDLPGSNKKGILPAGIAYRGAELVDNTKVQNRDQKPGTEQKNKYDPLLALVRYADNLDMQESRFSDFQRTTPFRRIYERLGAERSIKTAKGESSISNALTDTITGTDFSVEKAHKVLGKTGKTGEKPVLYEGELLNLAKTLIAEQGRDVALPRLLQLVQATEVMKFGNPPKQISEAYKSQLVETLKQIADNPNETPKKLNGLIQGTMSKEMYKDESNNPDLTAEEKKYLPMVEKYLPTINEESFRHFGGCRPVKDIAVNGSTMDIQMKPEVIKSYRGLTATEKVPGHPPLNVPVSVYQIWRGVEAYESLTVGGKKMKLTIRVEGAPDFVFDSNKIPAGRSASDVFIEQYKKWEADNIK